jgi:hypothetical protein
MVPAAMFGILRRLNHRTAVEMQYDALKDFSQSFQAHLGKVEVTPGNVQEYRQQFKAWLLDRLEIDNKITPENKQVYVRKVNNGIQTRQSTNIEHLLDEWVGKLSNNAILKPGEKPSKKALNEFKELTGQLGEAIKDFNRKIDPHATDKTNNITFKQGEVGVKNWAWGDFAGQIERFSDYASSVFTRHGEQGGAKSLEQVAQEVFKQVRGTKALFAVLATALTGGYLFFLSKAVQHSKEYPANRLLKEDDVRGVESPESPVAQVGRQQPVMNFVPPQAPQVIAPRGASFMPNSPYAAPNPYAAAQRMTGPAPYPRGGNIRL